MVTRSKRSMSPERAAAMKASVLAFQHEVRGWCGQIPIGTTVYVALSNLNDALNLADSQLNAAIDDRRRGKGAGDIHDFD